MSTFSVQAVIANPARPQRRLGVELLVDTGATYSLLPDEVVRHLELSTPWQRTATLASGEDVTYAMGHVLMRLNGEELSTLFLAGPPGCQGLIGAVTLDQFALAADPVHQRLVPVRRVLLSLVGTSRAASGRRLEHVHRRGDVDPSGPSRAGGGGGAAGRHGGLLLAAPGGGRGAAGPRGPGRVRRAPRERGARPVRAGRVRIRIGGRERTTIFVAGPPGCLPRLGAVTLEQFALAVDPRRQRLVPARILGHI